MKDAVLDMRMDETSSLTAEYVVNNYNKKTIGNISTFSYFFDEIQIIHRPTKVFIVLYHIFILNVLNIL